MKSTGPFSYASSHMYAYASTKRYRYYDCVHGTMTASAIGIGRRSKNTGNILFTSSINDPVPFVSRI